MYHKRYFVRPTSVGDVINIQENQCIIYKAGGNRYLKIFNNEIVYVSEESLSNEIEGQSMKSVFNMFFKFNMELELLTCFQQTDKTINLSKTEFTIPSDRLDAYNTVLFCRSINTDLVGIESPKTNSRDEFYITSIENVKYDRISTHELEKDPVTMKQPYRECLKHLKSLHYKYKK